MKGARSRQEQLARERIQALKNKRKLSKKEEEAKKEKEQEDKENEALESNDPIQLQVIYKLTPSHHLSNWGYIGRHYQPCFRVSLSFCRCSVKVLITVLHRNHPCSNPDHCQAEW